VSGTPPDLLLQRKCAVSEASVRLPLTPRAR
jgi:hypothetical protein